MGDTYSMTENTSFWTRIASGSHTNLSILVYPLMSQDSFINGYSYSWIHHIKELFNSLGMTNIISLLQRVF